MKRCIIKVVLFLILVITFTAYNPKTIQVEAHSGRTDSRGGHWDRRTGTYHYHNGGNSSSSSSNSSYEIKYKYNGKYYTLEEILDMDNWEEALDEAEMVIFEDDEKYNTNDEIKDNNNISSSNDNSINGNNQNYTNMNRKTTTTTTTMSNQQSWQAEQVIYPTNYDNIIFNAKFYATKYNDLYNLYSNDSLKLYEHFMTFGMQEGRQGSEIFNVFTYKDNNEDLQNTFGNELTLYYQHFLDIGQFENRIAY